MSEEARHREPRAEALGRPPARARLQAVLDDFLARSDRAALAARDPVVVVRTYADPHDREVAGLAVAALAYGRASFIIERARALLAPLGPHPSRAIAAPGGLEALEGFVYRFQRGSDFVRFFQAIAAVRAEHGSLGAAFAAGLRADDPDYLAPLDRWVLALRAHVPDASRGLRFLLPRAAQTGAAKRLCLFLRWMIRDDDGVDLGAWQALVPGALTPARLVIPLDTHIERIGRYVGLTERRSPGLETARDITRSLARLRPHDPLAYDLALCHLGISGACRRRRVESVCRSCPIQGICRVGRGSNPRDTGPRARLAGARREPV